MILSNRFNQALSFTFELHRDQFRKGNQTPYIAHLLAVSALVLESGGSEDEAIAGLLHDAPEDRGGLDTLDKIRSLFGDQVAEIVDGCTDTYLTPKPPWRERKETYLRHLPDASLQVRLVSLADKLNNSMAILRDYREFGEEIWDRFNGGKEGTLWYYRSLVKIFRESGFDWMTLELERVVGEIEQLVKNNHISELK
jgi:(p)ppGpp synthase/HD superfamily hydrolase